MIGYRAKRSYKMLRKRFLPAEGEVKNIFHSSSRLLNVCVCVCVCVYVCVCVCVLGQFGLLTGSPGGPTGLDDPFGSGGPTGLDDPFGSGGR